MNDCIQCPAQFTNSEGSLWCGMECKEAFFIKYFEPSQWIYKLINQKVNLILKKVEAGLIFPFEGTLKSGEELLRPKVLDMQRTAFNKIVSEEYPDYETKREYHIYICKKCGFQMDESHMGEKCTSCGMWTYHKDCQKHVKVI